MAVSARMACQFSKDGKYFAQITSEGKLKVWNTLSNTFEQEFTPDFHLTSPCTCLHFISSDAASKVTMCSVNYFKFFGIIPTFFESFCLHLFSFQPGSPRKKRRKASISESQPRIALGTSNGRLLIYSLLKADLEYVVDSKTSQSISCLSLNNSEVVYSGADTSVIVWNLSKKEVSR